MSFGCGGAKKTVFGNCSGSWQEDKGLQKKRALQRLYFLKNTVREELEDVVNKDHTLPYDLSELNDRHPYDISGGQQQLLALAKVLSSAPQILLLDEPTKGLDAYAKKEIGVILHKLAQTGLTVVCVTHDVEFAAEWADRCAMFFRGEITSCGIPSEFFAGNNFYTTAVNRMTSNYYKNITTVSDAVKIMRINMNGGAE